MNELLEAFLYLFLPFLGIVCCCCPMRKRGHDPDGSTICDDGWGQPLCWVLLETRCLTRIPPTRVLCIVEGTSTTGQEQSQPQSQSQCVYVMEVEAEEVMQTVPREAEWDNRV